jgi:hypothetical protein
VRVEIKVMRVIITFVRVKIKIRVEIILSVYKSHLLVSKSHPACRNHSRECRYHIRACQNQNSCGNYTLLVLITLVSVIFKRIRVKITLV